MLGNSPIPIAAALACVIAGGWTSAAAALPASPAAGVRSDETDQQRRQRLDARMAEMLRSGDGARLNQPTPPRRPSAPRRAAPRPAPPASVVPVAPAAASPSASVSATSEPAWTIQPPAHVGGAAPRSNGGYYTPPVLDLTTPIRVPVNDIECLTQAIYYEARNESEEGQAAVAEVVMNRSRSGAYPTSVCAVVYQRNSRTCQFTFTCDGAIGRSPVDLTKWARAERIARAVHEGRSPPTLPRTSLNYHADYVSPSWGRRLQRVRQIGAHIFYSVPLGAGVTPGALAAPAQAAASGLMFVRNEALDRAYEAAIQAAQTAQTAGGGAGSAP